jgi:cysteine desulfurase
MTVYADNAATMKISKRALAAYNECAETTYANPSSLHSEGQRAAERLLRERERIAAILGAEPAGYTLPPAGRNRITSPCAPGHISVPKRAKSI